MPLSETKSNYKHKFELWKFRLRSCEFRKAITQSLMAIAEEATPDTFKKLCLIQSIVRQMEKELNGSFKYVEENLL